MDNRPGSHPKSDRSHRRRRGNPYAAGALASIGVEIVASICGLGAVGWGIDYLARTEPWGLVVGLILGLVGGMYNSVTRALRIMETTSDNERKHHGD